MAILDEIRIKTKELEELIHEYESLKEKFNTLNIGDTVYISGSYGDMFPQKILNIDYDNLLLDVFEESIKSRSIIQYFYVFNEETGKFN